MSTPLSWKKIFYAAFGLLFLPSGICLSLDSDGIAPLKLTFINASDSGKKIFFKREKSYL